MSGTKNRYDSDLELESGSPESYKWEFLYDCLISEVFGGGTDNCALELAGRIVRKRRLGKLAFAELYGDGSEIQLVFDNNSFPTAWKFFCGSVSVGDIVGVYGKKGKTKNGTDSVWVEKITLLTKAVSSLPDKYHGVKNMQTCRRAAYLDVLANREKYDVFRKRSGIIQGFRSVLLENGYMEVDTPILSTVECASNARQFVAHHNALNAPVYLRVSAEIQLKQMVLCGYGKIFEFCRNFRNEGTDKYHRQEFLNLEIFSAYSTVEEMKALIIRLIKAGVGGDGRLVYGNRCFETDGIPTYDIHGLIYDRLGIDVFAADTLDSLKKVMRDKGITDESGEGSLTNKNACINRMVDLCVEREGFYFLKGYPVELYPLCRTEEGTSAAGMEYLYFSGMCIAQLCKEETDPKRLRALLDAQAENSDKEVSSDTGFITAASYGLPPMCGIGISMERLIMLFCGAESMYDSNFFHLTKN